MTTDSSTARHEWQAASRRSPWRWPATIALGGTVVTAAHLLWSGDAGLSAGPLRLDLTDAFCIFACVLVASFPVWYHATSRIVRSRPVPSVFRQLAACLGLFVVAVLASPRFQVEWRDYDSWSRTDRHDFTTTWIKRSLPETLREPLFRLDELAWLQSNYSAAYIPAQVYCPRRSTRFVPFFGVVRDDAAAGALAPGIGDPTDTRPPAAALANTLARCQREGPRMLAAGDTKEAALMKGDIDRFFALDARGDSREHAIVLEDAAIPKAILDKIEVVLKQADGPFEYLDDANYADSPGRVRRLRPLAVAAALGRSADVERLTKQQ